MGGSWEQEDKNKEKFGWGRVSREEESEGSKTRLLSKICHLDSQFCWVLESQVGTMILVVDSWSKSVRLI